MPTADAKPRTPPPLLDLPALRQRTLDQMILLAAVMMTGSGALTFYRNLSVGWSPLVFVSLVAVPAMLWSLHLARRRLSYQYKAVLLILGSWGLAINALVMVGPVANAKSLVVLIVLLSMLFLSPRAGWLNVAVGALVLGAVGAAAVTGLLAFNLDYPRYVKTPAVWLQTVFSFTAYSACTAFIAARLLHSLDATVQALHTQTRALGETQAQLQAALNHQRAMFNNSSAGIALLDGERTILDANPRFCALLGYRDADLIGQSTRLIHRDQTAFETLGAGYDAPPADGSAYSEDLQVRRRDGSLLWTQASLSPLDPAAPRAGAVLVLVDIEARKRAELALAFAKQQAESATRAKSRFLATVTHELRTPLHAILGFAEVLDRIDEPGAEPDGDLDGDAGLPPCVWLDGRRLTQVLTNLLGNAVALTRQGEVRLSAAATPDPAAPDRVDLRLTVADTGPGIPAAEQERIFAAFIQVGPDGTAPQGSGLGLNISRQLVRQMSGRIELDSAPGQGSRFTLVLPAVALARADDCTGAAAAAPAAGPATRYTDTDTETAPPATAEPPAPPPRAALAELRALADLGRTTRIEAWCRQWSAPAGRPAFAAAVLALAHAFEHGRIIALVDAQAERADAPSGDRDP